MAEIIHGIAVFATGITVCVLAACLAGAVQGLLYLLGRRQEPLSGRHYWKRW